MSEETYYCPHDLARFGEVGKHRPELFEAWNRWYNECLAEGSLSRKTKCLIALAVAHHLYFNVAWVF